MFQKGHSGNPNGRAKGVPDKVRKEVRELARALFDHAYWERTRERLNAGKLPPFIEAKLLAYAYGEPDKNIKHSGIVVNIGFLGTTPDAGALPTLIEAVPRQILDTDNQCHTPSEPGYLVSTPEPDS